MSTEHRMFVKMPSEAIGAVLELERLSRQALARDSKAPIGDRTEVLRFERAQSEIELLAIVAANGNAPVIRDVSPASGQARTCRVTTDQFPNDITAAAVEQLRQWLDEDDAFVIECAMPLNAGTTAFIEGTGAPRPLSEMWESESGSRGKEAVRERFLDQLSASLEDGPERSAALNPSGMPNTVLTESLRDFATRSQDAPPTLVPVAYRDGSTARPFPLRGLDLIDDRNPRGRVLSFCLLSIRHVALDPLVDGARLRNTEISRPRPAGDTDELAYRGSVDQIARLCSEAQMTIVMYQTGLETAIVGFYRAVAEYLAVRPDRLIVLPRYFHEGGEYTEGSSWRVR